MRLINSIKALYHEYPRQYWLMINGIVLATAGGSMIWPFLLIYATGKLNLPLSTVATLISINAGMGLISSFIAGTLADKIGRKVVMNISLTVTGLAYLFLMRAETYPQFALLMIVIGLFQSPSPKTASHKSASNSSNSEVWSRNLRSLGGCEARTC